MVILAERETEVRNPNLEDRYVGAKNLLRICILHIRQRCTILVGQGEVVIVDLVQLGRVDARLIWRCGTGFRFHFSKNRVTCVT